jgi:hypothetical protein
MVGILIAMLGSGALVALLLMQRKAPAVQPMTRAVPAPGARPPAPTPLAEPLPEAADKAAPRRPGPPPPPLRVALPASPPRRAAARVSSRRAEPAEAAEARSQGTTPQSVESKFKQVGQEYTEFKKNFGARLEDRWQQILQEASLGRRDQHLDDLLNQLRREMGRIRSGG